MNLLPFQIIINTSVGLLGITVAWYGPKNLLSAINLIFGMFNLFIAIGLLITVVIH